MADAVKMAIAEQAANLTVSEDGKFGGPCTYKRLWYIARDAALAALEQGVDGEGEGFAIGDPVEKFTGEAIWHGTIAASYLTSKGKRRYVVEVEPQGFQMIAVPSQLRALSSANRGE